VATTAQSVERIIYVDLSAVGANDGSSWTDAYVRLPEALAAAATEEGPAEIRVAQGTYRPGESVVSLSEGISAFLLPGGVALRGGYAGRTHLGRDVRDVSLYPTVLQAVDGETFPGEPDLSYSVVTTTQTGSGTELDGVTVTGGFIGMEVTDANVVITRCVFEGNERAGILSRSSNVTLSECYFSNNPGTALDKQRTDVGLDKCRFEYNGSGHSIGGAIEGHGNTIDAADCLFSDNEGAAIDGSGTLDLLRCRFVGNNTRHDGVIDFSGSATMRQCRYESNTTTWHPAAIRITGDTTLVDCEFIDNSTPGGVLQIIGDVVKVSRCSFIGNSCEEILGSLLSSLSALTSVSHCLFSGNTGGDSLSEAITGSGATLEVSNCTFSNNRFQTDTIGGHWDSVTLTQSVLWDVPGIAEDRLLDIGSLDVAYCDIEGGYPGRGNIDVEPVFVSLGYWADPNDLGIEVGPDNPEAVWVAGDCHLQSQAGHWDRQTQTWVLDDQTSPCIDAGDPNGYLGAEPFPNGGYVNLGAYGGTAEASRSYFGKPVCENQLAGDINGDCIVDQTDMDILLSHWLEDSTQVVDIPPVVTMLSPADGAELTNPEPIELRAAASDPDGYIWYVSYTLEGYSDSGGQTIVMGGNRESDDWVALLDWSRIEHDTVFTITATATDNQGGKTTSAPITVTLHP